MPKSFWVFSNMPVGEYGGSFWDTGKILKTKRWYFKEENPNALTIRKGDIAVARIYKQNYIAHFRCGSAWIQDKAEGRHIGYIKMEKVERFLPPLPQWLIIDELTNKNVRNKIIHITETDYNRIHWAQALYKKMGGQGSSEENVILLERGLEEALKHNLPALGFKLADKKLSQQFKMAIGRSDLICTDKKGDYWVIELKRGQQTSDEVVGQVNRYRGWLCENVVRGKQKVNAMIVCGGADQNLIYACKGAGVELRTFKIPN